MIGQFVQSCIERGKTEDWAHRWQLSHPSQLMLILEWFFEMGVLLQPQRQQWTVIREWDQGPLQESRAEPKQVSCQLTPSRWVGWDAMLSSSSHCGISVGRKSWWQRVGSCDEQRCRQRSWQWCCWKARSALSFWKGGNQRWVFSSFEMVEMTTGEDGCLPEVAIYGTIAQFVHQCVQNKRHVGQEEISDEEGWDSRQGLLIVARFCNEALICFTVRTGAERHPLHLLIKKATSTIWTRYPGGPGKKTNKDLHNYSIIKA